MTFAVCLDGTAPAYSIDAGSGSGANKWIVHLQVIQCKETCRIGFGVEWSGVEWMKIEARLVVMNGDELLIDLYSYYTGRGMVRQPIGLLGSEQHKSRLLRSHDGLRLRRLPQQFAYAESRSITVSVSVFLSVSVCLSVRLSCLCFLLLHRYDLKIPKTLKTETSGFSDRFLRLEPCPREVL